MPVTLTIASVPGQIGPVPGPDGNLTEHVTVTGASSVANDTGTYTTKFIKNPERFVGAFGYSFSGRDMTLTDVDGIGDKVFAGMIIGRA